jgi:hypothetical protein
MRPLTLPAITLAISAVIVGAAALYASRVPNVVSVAQRAAPPEPKTEPKPRPVPRRARLAPPSPPTPTPELTYTPVPEPAPQPPPLPPLPFDLQSIPAPPGFEGVPVADLLRNNAHSIDDQIITQRAGRLAGRAKIAAGCLRTIQTNIPGKVIQYAVINVIDTVKGYQVDSVQLLPPAMDEPEGRVTATGYEECMRRVYDSIKIVPALDGWSPQAGTKRRVLLESAMPPGYDWPPDKPLPPDD